jgi:hypothetical protein
MFDDIIGNIKKKAPEKISNVKNITDARTILRDAFIMDVNFHMTYIANIAMLLHDRYDGADFKNIKTRDQAANDILHLILD